MMNLHDTLVTAVKEYDRKESSKASYNRYALPQYLARIADIEADVANGADLRAALVAGFCGRLLTKVLKATGCQSDTKADQMGGYVYTPVSKR